MAKRSRAKRKARASIGVDLASVQRKQPDGKRRIPRVGVDPSIAPLINRCRIAGLEPTAEHLREVRHPMYSADDYAGQVICKQADKAELWDAIVFLRKVVRDYDKACSAPNRHAQSMALLLPLEEMTADAASPPVDDRTDVEKVNQANAAWARVQGWLDRCKMQAGDTKRAVWDVAEHFDRDALLIGLRAVVRGIKGEI